MFGIPIALHFDFRRSGIDFAKIGYLNYCAQAGLGEGDLKKIEIVGSSETSFGEATQNAVAKACQRDITEAILQEHLEGDTVKFYAVRETDLFHWYYLNGVYHTAFNEARLREFAAASAEALRLYVYGGDAIIGRDGSITIIDINDWPSFAPVRDQASKHIAQLIYRKALSYAH